jgi:hypothetical protein
VRLLKQSTSVDLPIGPFVDQTDGITAETGLTLTQPDIRLKKNGGAWAQKAAAQTLSHEENGWYEVTLDTTDTDTLGQLMLAVNESGAMPVWHEFMVVPANVWDSLFGADLLQVDLQQWIGTAPLALASQRVVTDVGAISGDSAAADNLETAADGGSYNLGGGGVVAASVTGAVGSVTGNVGGNVTGSIGSLGAQAKLDVNAEADTALADYDAPTKAELDSAVAPLALEATVATVDTVVDAIKAKTDSLTFTVAGQVDANVQAVNDVELVGDGDATPWGPV